MAGNENTFVTTIPEGVHVLVTHSRRLSDGTWQERSTYDGVVGEWKDVDLFGEFCRWVQTYTEEDPQHLPPKQWKMAAWWRQYLMETLPLDKTPV